LRKARPIDADALTKAFDEGFRKGKIAGYGEGVIHANDQMQSQIDRAMAAFSKTILVEARNVQGWRTAVSPANPPPAKASPPKATPAKQNTSTDTLSNPQRRILRSLHFWHSVGHNSPSREQVAGVAGYSPGSGGFNNLVGAMRTGGLLGTSSPGTLSLNSVDSAYEMSAAEAKDMLLSVLSNPHKKIVAAFEDEAALSRDDVATRSGYSAGSGGFNNLVGKLNTLDILERPAQGMLAMTEWAKTVLDQ
jgi:hypothetical protein